MLLVQVGVIEKNRHQLSDWERSYVNLGAIRGYPLLHPFKAVVSLEKQPGP